MAQRAITVSQHLDPEASFRKRLEMEGRGEKYDGNVHAVRSYEVLSAKNYTDVPVGSCLDRETLDGIIEDGVDVMIRN